MSKTIKTFSFLFAIAAIVTIVGGHLYLYDGKWNVRKLITDVYSNIGISLGTIAITLGVVDNMLKREERREAERKKKENLLTELHSPVNQIALNAVHELRALKRLTGEDAWTKGAKLGGKANLTEARLFDANFESARLIGVNFYKADLRSVNFYNADLTASNLFKADITNAKFNEQTILPDGSLWKSSTKMSNFTNRKNQ